MLRAKKFERSAKPSVSFCGWGPGAHKEPPLGFRGKRLVGVHEAKPPEAHGRYILILWMGSRGPSGFHGTQS